MPCCVALLGNGVRCPGLEIDLGRPVHMDPRLGGQDLAGAGILSVGADARPGANPGTGAEDGVLRTRVPSNRAFIPSTLNRAPFPQGGYNVVFQPLAGSKASGRYVVFADGFAGAVKEPGQAAHRPQGWRWVPTVRPMSPMNSVGGSGASPTVVPRRRTSRPHPRLPPEPALRRPRDLLRASIRTRAHKRRLSCRRPRATPEQVVLGSRI
jgi:hypothetical protein